MRGDKKWRGQIKTIRTPGGICLGKTVPIRGQRGIHVQQGRKEENLLPEQIVEAITGKAVAKIVYKTENRN